MPTFVIVVVASSLIANTFFCSHSDAFCTLKMGIAAVIFDLDNTLIWTKQSDANAFVQVIIVCVYKRLHPFLSKYILGPSPVAVYTSLACRWRGPLSSARIGQGFLCRTRPA